MNKKEKVLLLELILRDIRGNWTNQGCRVSKAFKLARELEEKIKSMGELVDTIGNYDYIDGRYFRDKYPKGYINMNELHDLSYTILDKSEDFKEETQILTFPEYCFEDWNEYNENT